jgi:hypothetical protein
LPSVAREIFNEYYSLKSVEPDMPINLCRNGS